MHPTGYKHHVTSHSFLTEVKRHTCDVGVNLVQEDNSRVDAAPATTKRYLTQERSFKLGNPEIRETSVVTNIHENAMDTGTIVAVVIGVLLAISIVAVVVFIIIRKPCKKAPKLVSIPSYPVVSYPDEVLPGKPSPPSLEDQTGQAPSQNKDVCYHNEAFDEDTSGSKKDEVVSRIADKATSVDNASSLVSGPHVSDRTSIPEEPTGGDVNVDILCHTQEEAYDPDCKLTVL